MNLAVKIITILNIRGLINKHSRIKFNSCVIISHNARPDGIVFINVIAISALSPIYLHSVV